MQNESHKTNQQLAKMKKAPLGHVTDLPTEAVASPAITLTPESAALLKAIVRDAGNWGGTPPTYEHITKAGRGNLTDLKRKKLVSTFRSDGHEWIEILPAGKALAATLP